MAVNLNKANHDIFEDWMIDRKAPGAPTITIRENSDGTKWQSKSMDLFASLDTKKTIVGYLRTIGLDPFKKGTKEPAAIKEALSKVSWDDIKDGPKGGKSMFDQGFEEFNPHVSRLFTKELELLLVNNENNDEFDERPRPYVARLFNAGGPGFWLLNYIVNYICINKDNDYKSVFTFKERMELQEQGYVIDDVIVKAWANLGDDEMAESGDVSLKELAAIKNHMGIGIERDKHFSPTYETK